MIKNGVFNKFITILLISLLVLSSLLVTGCSSQSDSGDQKYESSKISVEGLPDGTKEISISELRSLPQHKLDASYRRTTGKYEKFKMEGPYLAEVIEQLGGNISDYAGVGVQGSDAYYCLIPKEVIDKTPDLMIAVKVDGEAKLKESEAPARLGVQGQFGPYWVKKINKIILYKQVPKKEIRSVWVFSNLADGIEPYQYEYYGSKDNSIELEKIFARFDSVDDKAFFTMKSSDGFEKNEAINMVKSRYYIKVDGVDAPTNISPYIKLGMNVKNISWISTNSDAAVFPEQLEKYLDVKEIKGKKGISLSEILYEVKVNKLSDETFEMIGTEGEKETVSGQKLQDAILSVSGGGKYAVIWPDGSQEKDIANLLRIRLVKDKSNENKTSSDNEPQKASVSNNPSEEKKDIALTISGNGVAKTTQWSLEELKALKDGYYESKYSIVNNWPTKNFAAAKGIDLSYLLKKSGLENDAKSIRVEATDGYYAEFTRNQLLNNRYFFPELLKGSKSSAVLARAILAFEYSEGTKDLTKTKKTNLRLVIGQAGLLDVNTTASVQNVNKIIITTDSPGKWEKPVFSVSSGKVDAGTQLELTHPTIDKIKIYYTTDGSQPDYDSPVYNPSTTYFQPELTKPITINNSITVKAFACGFGKEDSDVVTYQYSVK